MWLILGLQIYLLSQEQAGKSRHFCHFLFFSVNGDNLNNVRYESNLVELSGKEKGISEI
jgi:hypothetical protein